MRQNILLLGIVLIMLSGFVASVQAANCDDIWIDAEDISIDRDDTDYFYFPIHNEAEEMFTIYDIEIYREDGDFEIWLPDYTNPLDGEDEGELTIKARTGHLDNESLGEAYIKIRGQFEEDEYCGFSDIPKTYFDVDVEFDEEEEPSCEDIEINASNVYLDEDSIKTVSFSIDNESNEDFELYDIEIEENSSYFDIDVYDIPSEIDADDRESFRIRIEADNVDSDKEGDVTIKVKGRFDNGDYCSYNNIDEEIFTVFVDSDRPTSGGSNNTGTCSDIYLNAGTVNVEQGNTTYATIFLENDSDEDFLIDYISVFDSSSEFQAEENGYEKRIDAFDSSYINVKVRAYDYANTGDYEAFVDVKGHFQNGDDCHLSSGVSAFHVEIEEDYSEPVSGSNNFENCKYFSLIVPDSQVIGNSGFVEVVIDNRSMERATVKFDGPGLTVEPQLISIPRNTLISRNVNVSSVLAETNLVYIIEALGCNRTEITKIVSTAVEQEPEPQEPAENNEGNEELNETLQGFSTGFVVLGQAGAALGLIALVGIALYLIFRP